MLIAVAVAALSWLGAGLVLLLVRRAVPAAGLLVLTGGATLVGVALATGDRPDPARLVLVAAGSVGAPLALAAYPRLRRGGVVDVVILAVVLGCGLAATVSWRDDELVATLGMVGAVALFAHTWWRIETSVDRERRALLWMSLTVGSATLVIGLAIFATDGSNAGLMCLGLLAAVGPALYVGAAAPDIVDVRAVVVRAVVLAVAVVTYVALFVALAAMLELVGGRALSLGASAVVGAFVAMTLGPLQVMLRGVIDELLFGARPDPLDAAGHVADRVGDDPVLALRAVREALMVPYAALRTGERVFASSGTESTHTRSFVLERADAELVVGLRPGELALSPSDAHVLRLTAPLLAQALRSRALAADLQESRGATIAALEEERRRLRRDLHDGLGPRLSGIAFTSDAARNLLHIDPVAADALLATLRAETSTAIAEIRQLVYAMRPPALDEIGLVPALRQQSTGLRTRDGRPLSVTLVMPDALPPLPAAVEVATYRIVVEALTNVARHATGAAVTVRLWIDASGLSLEVTDSSAGPLLGGEAWHPGVGMASMRERAVELGGTLTAGPTAQGGRVRGLLPLGT